MLVRPFKHKINNVLLIINEGSLLCVSLLLQVFKFNNKRAINMAGWLMISVVGINIVTNFMISIVYNVRSKIEMCKRSKFRVSK